MHLAKDTGILSVEKQDYLATYISVFFLDTEKILQTVAAASSGKFF
jgi:hypothetical protein